MTRSSYPLFLLLLGTLVLGSRALYGQDVGGYAGSFLRRAVVPEEIGHGGAFTPFLPTSLALFTNSAALPLMQRPSVAVAASILPFGQSYGMMAGATNIGEFGGMGFGILKNFGLGDIPRRDGSGRRTGTTGNQDLAFLFGGGLLIGPGSIGATIRYLRQDFAGIEGSANGYTLDLSGTLSFRNQLFFAFSMTSIAGEMRAAYVSGLRWSIPWQARLGATYLYPLDDVVESLRVDPSGIPAEQRRLPHSYLLFIGELRTSRIDSTPVVSVALEAVPLKTVPIGLRGGWNSLGDVSLGLMLDIPVEFTRDFRIDYAMRRDFELGDISQHVSVTTGF